VDPGAERGAGDQPGPVTGDTSTRGVLPDVTPPGSQPLALEPYAALRPGSGPPGLDDAGLGAAVPDEAAPDGASPESAVTDVVAVPPAPRPDPEDVAGSALGRLTVLPVLILIAWLLPGLPLLLAGQLVPVPMLLISIPLLVGLVANGLRVVPSRWPRLLPGRLAARGWTSWLGLLGTAAVAAAFAAWQLAEAAESVIVLRSPGAYLQAGYWLAQRGSLPIPVSLAAFGGAHAGLGFASAGFFAHGASVVPVGTSGLPMLLAGGFWAHGTSGAAAIGPLLGGFAVLSFGGLVARLAGPQWAPAGALVLGLTLPEQYVSRAAFTEPAVQVLLFGGLCLLTDALTLRTGQPRPWAGWRRPATARSWSVPSWSRRPWPGRSSFPRSWPAPGAFTPERTLAALAGLALGLGLLVSLDSLVYLLPVIPFGGLLLATRRPGAAPFCWGVGLGAGYGLLDGYVLSRPFMTALSRPLLLAGFIAAWLIALTAATVQLLRVPPARAWLARQAARRPVRWLPALASLIAVAVLIGFAVRPYLQRAHDAPGVAVFRFIAGLQRAQGLPVDPTRTYAESTLYWVIWYIGLPAVLLGGFGIALLARQCVQALLTGRDPSGSWRNWALPLSITCVGSAAVLWDPDILPDQPWASRRLVIGVLPGLIACALWASAWLTGHARARGARPVTAAVAGLCCVAALAVPTGATAFGAGLSHSGRSGGLGVSASGLAFRRTGAGETSAVAQLCSTIPRDASVVILDRSVARQFTQVIRGMCSVPAAWVTGRPAAVTGVLDGIARAGRRPVLLGARRAQLDGFGGTPFRVLDLVTTQDPHQLTRPPTALATIRFVIWMVAPRPGGTGT
jgi:hypothetical protein